MKKDDKERSNLNYNYNPYRDNNYKPNASGIMSMGTILIRDWTGYANLPICVYLGDLNRPGSVTVTDPTVSFGSSNSSSSGSAVAGKDKEYFSNDHQGMS